MLNTLIFAVSIITKEMKYLRSIKIQWQEKRLFFAFGSLVTRASFSSGIWLNQKVVYIEREPRLLKIS
jgi:hypothetical protein